MATQREIILSLKTTFDGAGLSKASTSLDSLATGSARVDAALAGMDSSGLRAQRTLDTLAQRAAATAAANDALTRSYETLARSQATLSTSGGNTAQNQQLHARALRETADAAALADRNVQQYGRTLETAARQAEAAATKTSSGALAGFKSSVGNFLENPTGALYSGPGLAAAALAYGGYKVASAYSGLQNTLSGAVATSTGRPADYTYLQSAIPNLANSLNNSVTNADLGAGIYPILSRAPSGGIKAAVDELRTAAQFSAASGNDPNNAVSTQDAATAISIARSAYGSTPNAPSSHDLGELIFSGVAVGGAAPKDFASAIGRFGGITAAAGIKAPDAVGYFAQLTKTLDAQQSSQDVISLVDSVQKAGHNSTQQKIASTFGIELGPNAFRDQGGISGFVKRLQNSGADAQNIQQILGNEAAYGGYVQASGANYGSYLDTQSKVGTKGFIEQGQKVIDTDPTTKLREAFNKLSDDITLKLGKDIDNLAPAAAAAAVALGKIGSIVYGNGAAAIGGSAGNLAGIIGDSVAHPENIAGHFLQANKDYASILTAGLSDKAGDLAGSVFGFIGRKTGDAIGSIPRTRIGDVTGGLLSGAGGAIGSALSPTSTFDSGDNTRFSNEEGQLRQANAAARTALRNRQITDRVANNGDDARFRNEEGQAAAANQRQGLVQSHINENALQQFRLGRAGLQTAIDSGDTRSSRQALNTYLKDIQNDFALDPGTKLRDSTEARKQFFALSQSVDLKYAQAGGQDAATGLFTAQRGGNLSAIDTAIEAKRQADIATARIASRRPDGKVDSRLFNPQQRAIDAQALADTQDTAYNALQSRLGITTTTAGAQNAIAQQAFTAAQRGGNPAAQVAALASERSASLALASAQEQQQLAANKNTFRGDPQLLQQANDASNKAYQAQIAAANQTYTFATQDVGLANRLARAGAQSSQGQADFTAAQRGGNVAGEIAGINRDRAGQLASAAINDRGKDPSVLTADNRNINQAANIRIQDALAQPAQLMVQAGQIQLQAAQLQTNNFTGQRDAINNLYRLSTTADKSITDPRARALADSQALVTRNSSLRGVDLAQANRILGQDQAKITSDQNHNIPTGADVARLRADETKFSPLTGKTPLDIANEIFALTPHAIARLAPSFVPGRLDPGIDAQRGSAVFRTGVYSKDSSAQQIALLTQQVNYLQQQLLTANQQLAIDRQIASNTAGMRADAKNNSNRGAPASGARRGGR